MADIRGVIVDPNAVGCLAIHEVGTPTRGPTEALVRVKAISLNRGEVRRAQTAAAGTRIGYDLAGIVESPARSGSGPAEGARVVGLLTTQDAWAELVAVPIDLLAELPDDVSFEEAATLPVAGLTALYALRKGGALLGQRVLVTGASGGVGHLAIQLARDAGATVVGLVRRDEHVPLVRDAGAREVVVDDESGVAVASFGPFDLVLESVGGSVLTTALANLAQGGTCVTFGASANRTVTFEVGNFFRTGPRTLYGMYLFEEFRSQTASASLSILANLVAEERLRPHIAIEASWTRIGEVAQQLIDREYTGKAVLRVE
jgi:NADPH:quinone reductase